jgi:formamidopyrimidine-DNA glycosylase
MPELPEVETIRRRLAPRVEGRRLAALRILDPRFTLPLAPDAVVAAIAGRRLDALGRYGKYLDFAFEDDVHLLLHLRMTGTLLLDPAARPPHARVDFDFAGARVVFNDPRRFGTGELAIGPAAHAAFFAARLGLEPFHPGFTAAHVHRLAMAARTPVKAFLLDQKRIAGVGNIYADEALFRARIHPLRPANRLTRRQCAALRDGVVAALEAGVEAKGASIDDFRDPDGVRGSFQDRFLVHLREGEPCPVCGRALRKLRVAGRGTYVCERCQPRPRRYATRSRNDASPSARSSRRSS